MKLYDFYVFDCDGVLLDSNQLKTQAYRNSLKDFSAEHVNQLIDYHHKNGGVSRWEKFKYFLEKIVGRPVNNGEIDLLANEFSRQSVSLLKNANVTEGTVELLGELKNKKLPCFVVSGARQEEVQQALAERKLDSYFQLILGSPKNKVENVESFIAQFKGKKGVLVGDAMADMQCAEKYGMDFVFVYGFSELPEWDKNIPEKYPRVRNLKEYYQTLTRSGL
ncbi:MAG: HAD-IA family hydrolase [Bdellovibrionota bacterium]